MNRPDPVLADDVLYIGDGGRLHCGRLRCAGISAHFSGVGIDGTTVAPFQRVEGCEGRAAWISEFGAPPTCEGCGFEMPVGQV